MIAQELMARAPERAAHQFFGKYRGIVIDNADPLQLGRLQIQVPSVLGLAEEAVTDWASPCAPWGGASDQGFFFVPEIGAKVWVEFEEGNLDLPIWVGVFWSAPDETTEIPAEAREMENDQPQRRVLKTPSGHVLQFSDVEGQESITLRHKDGASVVLNEKSSTIVSNKEGSHIYLNAEDGEATFIDQNGNNIKMGDSGTTITNNDGTVVDLGGATVQVIAQSVQVRSETVSLGEGAIESVILGQTFAAMFDAHIHPTAWGPSGPPIPAPMPLSAPTNPAISKHVKVK